MGETVIAIGEECTGGRFGIHKIISDIGARGIGGVFQVEGGILSLFDREASLLWNGMPRSLHIAHSIFVQAYGVSAFSTPHYITGGPHLPPLFSIPCFLSHTIIPWVTIPIIISHRQSM